MIHYQVFVSLFRKESRYWGLLHLLAEEKQTIQKRKSDTRGIALLYRRRSRCLFANQFGNDLLHADGFGFGFEILYHTVAENGRCDGFYIFNVR